MNFKTSFLVGVTAVAATSLLAVTSHAKNIRWKMQSTWGSQVAINGESAVYFSNKVKSLSCLLYTSPSPRDLSTSRMPSSA